MRLGPSSTQRAKRRAQPGSLPLRGDRRGQAHALRLVAGGRRTGRAAPPLAGDAVADVVIVGGGYLGLWTAWQLKQLEPGCSTSCCSRPARAATGRAGETAASSPRCGTTCRSSVTGSVIVRAVEVCRASERAVHGIGTWCEENGDRRLVPRGRHDAGGDERGAARRLGRASSLRAARSARREEAVPSDARRGRCALRVACLPGRRVSSGSRRTSSRRGWRSGCGGR